MGERENPIQLVIPMAGMGTRFSNAGYELPKPLLPIHGVPMYRVVLGNLITNSVKTVTVICPEAWRLGRDLSGEEANFGVKMNVIEIDYVTQGPAKTIALAEPFLDPDLPIVTANSDQYIDASLHNFYSSLSGPQPGGSILCMQDSSPKWSYVKLSDDGEVEDVREKEVISGLATVGLYGFSSARLMMAAFKDMFSRNDMAFDEFYVAPAFKYIIEMGLPIQTVDLGPVGEVMHGLGVPEDYEKFLKTNVSLRAVGGLLPPGLTS